jgi:hypothetical protein
MALEQLDRFIHAYVQAPGQDASGLVDGCPAVERRPGPQLRDKFEAFDDKLGWRLADYVVR